MDNPLVSIIIPVLNRADLIGETLDSVMVQTYQNWECIVVDDGSTDQTKTVVQGYVKKDARFVLFDRPETHQPGGNGARNYGFEISNGEYIQWFDSDDLMQPDFLSEKINSFKKNPDYQSVVSRFTSFSDKKILEEQLQFREPYEYMYENTITGRLHINTPGIIYQRKFLEEIAEKFDESILQAQEYEFINRIFIKHPHNIYILDKSLCYVRRDTENAISSDFKISKSQNDPSYQANYKIIELLIAEKKFSKNLEKFYYQKHKEAITMAINNSLNEEALKYRQLVTSYLTFRKKTLKLFRFKLGVVFFKIVPIDNFFLVYRDTPLTRFIKKNRRRLYKTFFVKGYLHQQLKKKSIRNQLFQSV